MNTWMQWLRFGRGGTVGGNPTERAALTTIAAEWAVRLAAGPLAPGDQQQLDAWLARDARHLGALVQARAQWCEFDRLGALSGSRASRTAALPVPQAAAVWSRRGVVAAGLGSAGLLGLGWSMLAPAHEYYASAVGEVRRIPLEDGSMLMLNTDSRARVQFSRSVREVRLLRGEALFEVARDEQRPFVVQGADWEVRALGTVFGVRLRGTEVDVTVSQGAVELGRSRAGGAEARRISAREQLVLVPAHPARVHKLAEAVLERRFAWLEGMVAFSGEPLGDAVAEINRHNRRQIVIDDADLAGQPVVGAFHATDIDAFAAAAAAALGAQAVIEADTLHLRAVGPPQSVQAAVGEM
jgi:transmembrane sensor